MTDIDQQLSAALERRANNAVVRDDLDSILGDINLIRFDDSGNQPRRRGTRFVLTAAAGLVAVTAGLVWVQTVRDEPASTSQQPPQTDAAVSLPEVGAAPWAMPNSANRDRIDAFPILDELPDSASAGFSDRTEESWIGAIGMLQPDGLPRPLIAVTTFAKGQDPFPDAIPGRIDGVSEVVFDDGAVTLTWSVDDTPLTITGADLDTMYSLVEHIVPTPEGPDRGGYDIVGDLPVGFVELVAAYELAPMTFPTINSEIGEFAVSVDNGPVLAELAATGAVEWEPITINSLNGFISRGEQPLIALALSGDEIMYVSSDTKTRNELIEFAGTIRIGDESEFRSLRGATD